VVVYVNVVIGLGNCIGFSSRSVYALSCNYCHCSENFGNYFDSDVDAFVVGNARPDGVVVEYYKRAL
jgi:hypothetical protein